MNNCSGVSRGQFSRHLEIAGLPMGQCHVCQEMGHRKVGSPSYRESEVAGKGVGFGQGVSEVVNWDL